MTNRNNKIEPRAWMSYNNMGGAGLVPYLLHSHAERNTSCAHEDEAERFPQPLYYGEDVVYMLELLINRALEVCDHNSVDQFKQDMRDCLKIEKRRLEKHMED